MRMTYHFMVHVIITSASAFMAAFFTDPPVSWGKAKQAHHSVRTVQKNKPSSDPAGQRKSPLLLATYHSWKVYSFQPPSKSKKICFALASGKNLPSAWKEAFLFVSHYRDKGPGRYEISFKLGSSNSSAHKLRQQVKIGTNLFDLMVRGDDAWLKNESHTAAFLRAMSLHSELSLRGFAPAGSDVIYPLSGVKSSLERIAQECAAS